MNPCSVDKACLPDSLLARPPAKRTHKTDCHRFPRAKGTSSLYTCTGSYGQVGPLVPVNFTVNIRKFDSKNRQLVHVTLTLKAPVGAGEYFKFCEMRACDIKTLEGKRLW